MARSRVSDYLSTSRFHLMDVSFSIPPVLIPIFGFRSVSMPNLSVELFKIKQGNYEYPTHVVKGATVGSIVLEQGVSLFNSDFYNWIRRSVTGHVGPKNLLLVQFTNINPAQAFGTEAGGFFGNAIGTGVGGVLGGFSFEEGVRLPGRAWLLQRCRPINYRPGTDFDAMSGEISIASLEIEMEEFEEFSMGV